MSTTSKDNDATQSDDPKFNLSALKEIAAEKLGKGGCTSIVDISNDNYFHKVYVLTMDDGSQYIGRLARPYFRRFKTESEVATLQFVAERTTIPVPKVYAWDADPDNPVGAEYILLEKIPGEPLNDRWEGLSEDEKKHVIGQLVDIQLQLFHTTFDKIGSLFKNADNDSYKVGILVDQFLYLGTRGKMKLDRGPWNSTGECLIGLVRSTSTFLDHPDALNDDEYDETIVDDIRKACQLLEEAILTIPSFQPTDASLERFCLQHTDLISGNIMVEGSKITGIIDWENAGVYPAWESEDHPPFLRGRSVKDDGEHREGERLKEHLELLEDTKYRHFFRSEIKRRDQEFKKVVEGAGELRDCKGYSLTLRILPNDVGFWLNRRESSKREESEDGERGEECKDC